PDLLATAIGNLLEDPRLRARMGEAARERAEERFDERRVAATVVGATRRLLVWAGRLSPRADASVTLRPARPADASAMATLHRRSMPTAFLPQLGDGFLRQLYLAAMEDPNTVAVVAERDGAFEGFGTATSSLRNFYRRFAIRRGVLAMALAGPRLARPSVIRRVRETAAYGNGRSELPDAELLSIAVAESSRGRGVGRALESEVRDGLSERGVSQFKVIVGANNVDANKFYASCGYRAAGETAVHDGASSRVWVATCRS
ncbi:MAG TPA: GNAT family N-acetyltransferase, partial [Gemmatimonadota bacterium]|nr:GNAT family N-acetyltransferase [Gemmatimonadota bacterium]